MSHPPTHIELHIPVLADELSMVTLLADASGLSKQLIKRTMQNGAVWLTHGRNTRRVRRAKQKLATGDEVHLYYDQEIQSTRPAKAQLIADESSYSVLFKPSGMYSQGSKWGDHCTINRWVERNGDRPAFIVHRLDRAASGLMLIAHSKTMATQLSALFEQRQIKKTYRAVIEGLFPSEVLVLDGDIDGRHARSSARLLDRDETMARSLVAVDIDTGRKHQIRRHLAEAGFPIVGDRLYGTSASDQAGHVLGPETGSETETDAGNVHKLNLQLVATDLSFAAPGAVPGTVLSAGEQKHYTIPEALLVSCLSWQKPSVSDH